MFWVDSYLFASGWYVHVHWHYAKIEDSLLLEMYGKNEETWDDKKGDRIF